MSKELTPLEALEDLYSYCSDVYCQPVYDKYYQIVETALKDYEKQDNIISIIKETIEFSVKEPEMEVKENGEISLLSGVGMSLIKQINEKEKELFREWVLKECFPEELKTLEIIKENFVLTSEYGKVSLEPKKIISENKLKELKKVLL